MKSLLVIIYKIEGGKGSEDASGYEVACELAQRGYRLTILSRKNNIALLKENPLFKDVELIGVDVPAWLGWFKRGGRGIIAYYYLWQIFVGRVVNKLNADRHFDVIHQLNFHTDWAPHFIKRSSSRLIWGPVMHHERVPNDCIIKSRPKLILAEWIKQVVKTIFWRCDPFLRAAVKRTGHIFYANHNICPAFESARDKTSFLPMPGAASHLSGESDSTVEFNVLSVGRLVILKGFDLTLAAFHRALQKDIIPAQTTLTIVGAGVLSESLIAQAKAWGIDGKVIFIDWIKRENLETYYKNASVFLYPSFESQGLVVGEAMGYGTPVISLEKTGPAFLSGDTGIQVPRGTYSEMVQGLSLALGQASGVYVDEGRLSYVDWVKRVENRFASILLTPSIIDEFEKVYHGG